MNVLQGFFIGMKYFYFTNANPSGILSVPMVQTTVKVFISINCFTKEWFIQLILAQLLYVLAY